MRLSDTMRSALAEIDRRTKAAGAPRIHRGQLTAGRGTLGALRERGLIVYVASVLVELTPAGVAELAR